MKVQFRDRKTWIEHKGEKLETLTLIHPFYNEKERFLKHLELWKQWSDDLKNRVNIVLIDDGSPEPVHSWFTPSIVKRLDYNIDVYRITEDLKWNTPGALNLGFTVAPTEWVLCMDSDCAFDKDNLNKFIGQDPLKDAVYKFPRNRIGTDPEENLENSRYLPCAMLMHKDVYWRVGGMDEDFTGSRSGGYAYFDNYFDHCVTECEMEWFIWHEVTALEWMPSIVGPKVHRSRDEEKHNKRIFRHKQLGRLDRNREILRFPWKHTFRKRRVS